MASLRSTPLSQQLIRYIHGLIIPQGDGYGTAVRLFPWERRLMTAIASRRSVSVTMARGNGKTLCASTVACAALDPAGPLFIPRGEINIVASSLTQATIAFDYSLDMMDPIIKKNPKAWSIRNSTQSVRIQHLPTRTTLIALGSDARRAHGRAPNLVIADEPAKWVKGGREMYVALDTSMGKQLRSCFLSIGTRPDVADHWFSELLGIRDETHWAFDYSTTKADGDFSMKSIRKANPSYDYKPSLRKELSDKRKKAKVGGVELFAWRSLRLNRGTPETGEKQTIVTAEDWMRLGLSKRPPREGPVCVGVDLGGSSAMTAICFYWPICGRLEGHGAFPRHPGLAERGKKDFVGYDYLQMHQRGELVMRGAYATDNVLFLTEMFAKIADEEIVAIGADMYKANDLKEVVVKIGKDPDHDVTWRRVGTGPQGSEDVRAFQREVLEAKMRPGHNFMLDKAIEDSVLRYDDNGNPALSKSRANGRIDLLQAAILAAGLARRYREPTEGPGLASFYEQLSVAGTELGVNVERLSS